MYTLESLKKEAENKGIICQNCKFNKLERDLSYKRYCSLTVISIKNTDFCSKFEPSETFLKFKDSIPSDYIMD